MKCPECGLEMFYYGAVTNDKGEKISESFVCGNKRCGRFDVKLKRKPSAAAAAEVTAQEVC